MTVAVAVSGGADSVCLLHVLLELSPRLDLRLAVLHLDHRLRGGESEADRAFVCSLASQYGLPILVREVEVAALGGNLEQAARQARLAFFRETVASGAADRVAVGHTRSDQAETVLYRFLRGSGSAGLAGIRPITSSGLIRPLLETDREEVEQFLREHSIPWREDSTNSSREFARNRMRHDLLPQLAREWNPAIRRTLARTADWAQAEEAWWETEIDRLAAQFLTLSPGYPPAIVVRTAALGALPLATARRLVRRAIETAKGDTRGIDFHHVQAILDMAAQTEGSSRIQAHGIEICRSFDWLRFSRPAPAGSHSSG